MEGGNLYSIIKEEVNVKSYVAVPSGKLTEYATLKLSLNNQILGKRLPEKMKQIIPASKKGEWKQVDGIVEICGEKLLADEYTLQLEPRPEYKDRAQALSTNDALVILDTTITPELEAEGIARDLVRMIQQARKDADFNVSDRIALAINASDKIMAAAKTHEAYISEQTLAKTFATTLPAKADFTSDNELEGNKVTIAISRI
jgi:isoleucyl-tRNA synthetase